MLKYMQYKVNNMHKYDYTFLKEYKIVSKLIGLSNVIYESNHKSQDLERNYPLIYSGLHKKAIIESTISSNRIEGIRTSPKREKELLSDNSKPLDHNEQEISGYKEAIIFISDHYDEIDISEATIKYLHSLLMYYSQDNKGGYKRIDNQITATHEDGSKEILFEPVSAFEVKTAMEQLIMAYRDAVNDSDINKMLLIPCFITDFLAIHPFQDGNGRISRLLTLLLLYKQGYDIGKYISYEKMIEDYKENYYQELHRSQEGWHENRNDYSPFIVFHFQMLYRCYSEINERFADILNNPGSTKTERIRNRVLNSLIPISKKDIADSLPDIGLTTIEKVLSDLLKENKIKKIGTYKNARYIRNDDVYVS